MGGFAWFQGIQVSLFDTSDPTQLARLDNHILGDRGSLSEATWDHHAFFFDDDTDLVGIPVTILNGSQVTTGAKIFKVTGDALVPAADLSHRDWIPAQCQGSSYTFWSSMTRSMDINRLFKVDGRILSVSRWGIKANDPAMLTREMGAIRFPGSSGNCAD
jgi:hypothetical protein